MTDSFSPSEDSSAQPASPLPCDVEHVATYAWRRGAVETIVFHSAAQLATEAGALSLEKGTWLLARWEGPPLLDTPDGELICVLPEALPDAANQTPSGEVPAPFPCLLRKGVA
jgi:hypothetical protein